MLIFLIRHGLTSWNAARRFQGTCDIPLNETGLAQAESCARRCAALHIERIYHSPLIRAAQTAQTLSQCTGAPLVPLPDLAEVNMGIFQGLTREGARARDAQAFDAYLADPAHIAPPQGETLTALQTRALRALHFACQDAAPCARIALVSHGALLKSMLCAIIGLPLNSHSHFDVSNASLSVLEYANGTYRLITLNDLSHLSDPYASMQTNRLMI